MSHGCILKSLAAISAALVLISVEARSEEEAQGGGPEVEIVTSANSNAAPASYSGSGPLTMPVERLPIGVVLSLSAGYDTNVSTTVDERPSFYTSASLGLNYSFGTERTRISTSWGTSLTYYTDTVHGQFDQAQPDTTLALSISHQVNERLTLNSGINLHYGIEPDFVTGASTNRRSGNYFYTGDSISASYSWLERLSTVTTYNIGVILYQDEPLSTLLDRYDHSISQQFRYLLLPMTTLTGQYGFSTSVYDVAGRDFYAHTISAGFDQTLGPRTQAGFTAGAQIYSAAGEGTSFGPYASGNLTFIVGEKTSLTWGAQYSTEEANIVEASTRKNFSTNLQLSYALTPRISTSISTSYTHSDYKGQKVLLFDPTRFIIFVAQPMFTEESFDLGLNLSYSITPRMSANVNGHYTEVSSDLVERPYSRAHFSAGLSYSF